jgi:hypothetical protein
MWKWVFRIFIVILIVHFASQFRYCRYPVDKAALLKVNLNYSKQIDEIAQELELEPAYFKALVVLECSGDKLPKSRFEEHVYKRLKAVKDGHSRQYAKMTQNDLKIFSDKTLKQFATSWGPLQIMGYHCLALGIGIDELKNENALKNGMIWCKKNYGVYLQKGQFKDAFHMHNTGKPHPSFGFPTTYDPKYIDRGLSYMNAFK